MQSVVPSVAQSVAECAKCGRQRRKNGGKEEGERPGGKMRVGGV